MVCSCLLERVITGQSAMLKQEQRLSHSSVTVWNLIKSFYQQSAFLNVDPGSRSPRHSVVLGLAQRYLRYQSSRSWSSDGPPLLALGELKKRLPLTSEEVWNEDRCAGCFNHSSSFRGLTQVQNRQVIKLSRHGQWCVANWVIGWTSDLSFN